MKQFITTTLFILTFTTSALANNEVHLKLLEIANDLAQVWADSILEDDFYAEGRVTLDKVTPIYRDNELIAYYITYSEKAWYVGKCHFNGHKETLVGCAEGRIVERGYVSADFTEAYVDERHLATFYFNQ